MITLTTSDDSSGEEYVPTAEDLEEMEPPILPSSRHGSGMMILMAAGNDEDEDDPLSFLYSLGLQKRGKKKGLDSEVCGDEAKTLPMP
ncbi:hypothetical protein E2C01_070569 [Portunus trituberculatus]|uniref:Uncharacterized protein n=1 Tax=Portunus trituberculatus TaxID=210409 RepID=A0A5B7I1N8_PORTR|nr:hypothetical protein [Portunus trituberculatus]